MSVKLQFFFTRTHNQGMKCQGQGWSDIVMMTDDYWALERKPDPGNERKSG